MTSPTRARITSMAIRLVLLAVALTAPSWARAQSCTAEIGQRESQQLVERCLEVSPATRPPCNVSNACSLIESEIVRGCRIVAEDAPRWCADYGQ
ncbi:hypothetical protein [Methylobacterium brachythecii]|uniref:Uncharacterized protein n=1 Tax=Methylobacterium brachythecii TaxID=1176177 RepID=A0A7W6AK21_9HYPH|nr:hypothetical protein [Methylobacterium brachythecii]MBB3903099.1 hypothetical protein [Methylobacterium brachythecii]GLS44679.1 hypothetical protein GCM10007884_26670 [Methylobacterium brachythecii]